MITNHEIDFQIHGEEMQYVDIELDPSETAIAESGAFMMMQDGIEMQTIFGDGSNVSQDKRKVSFASPYPGKIIAMDLLRMGGKMVCQKDSFLCAAKGVSVGIEFQRKLGTGLFGGEGFIMQKLEGDGMAFVHAGGHVTERELQPGELLKIDTGCVVAFTQAINYDIQFVGGIKNTLFGGEGLFFATLRGPGKVWIQTLPISRLAGRILAYGTYKRKEEGSILGGIGNLLDGDGR
jgi:uncharacterized protein (AIM24 family)